MHFGSARGTGNRAARLCVPQVSRVADSCAVGMHGPRGTMIDGAIRTVLFMSVLFVLIILERTPIWRVRILPGVTRHALVLSGFVIEREERTINHGIYCERRCQTA